MEIAEGLDAAHHHGLIHRDIKPANVWLEAPNESVCLLDFGLAREISKQSLLTDHGTVMGTPAYMSPEQARGERLDPRSDLFSLGCILYQMTTGIRPFDGPMPVNILGQLESYHPPRVTARNPAIPTLLSNLIMELLAKKPKDRPASARVVMERLRRPYRSCNDRTRSRRRENIARPTCLTIHRSNCPPSRWVLAGGSGCFSSSSALHSCVSSL